MPADLLHLLQNGTPCAPSRPSLSQSDLYVNISLLVQDRKIPKRRWPVHVSQCGQQQLPAHNHYSSSGPYRPIPFIGSPSCWNPSIWATIGETSPSTVAGVPQSGPFPERPWSRMVTLRPPESFQAPSRPTRGTCCRHDRNIIDHESEEPASKGIGCAL